jgi:hypothetical protein
LKSELGDDIKIYRVFNEEISVVDDISGHFFNKSTESAVELVEEVGELTDEKKDST